MIRESMTFEEQALKLSHPEVASVLAANQLLSEENLSLKSQLQTTVSQLVWLKKQIFGQKSEQRKYLSSSAQQMFLGETFESQSEAPPEPTTIKSYQRGKAQKKEFPGTPEDSGLRFDENEVPVEEVELPCPELEGEDKDQYEVVSKEASYKLAQKPAAYVVVKYIKTKVKRKDTGEMKTTPMPASVLGNSVADVSLLAGLIIDKSQYHLPLFRQHQRLLASKIMLSRSSLTSMLHASLSLLEPIYESQLDSIRASRMVWMDEIPMKAGRIEPGKMRDSYVWPIMGEQGEVCFVWKESRAHKHAKEILGDKFEGVLITDGYQAYSNYAKLHDEIIHAQCWSHTRRKFLDAEDGEPGLVATALDYIGMLYEVEKQIKELNLDEDKKVLHRLLYSKPIVEQFFDWLQNAFASHVLLPSSKFSVAANYALTREAGLKVFLSFPEVPLDTNAVERELRCIALGRKNWNFCWTEAGAKYLCIAQSLIRTCTLHKVDPWQYLVDVLQRVDSHPMSQVHQLTPRLWKENFQHQRLKSTLER